MLWVESLTSATWSQSRRRLAMGRTFGVGRIFAPERLEKQIERDDGNESAGMRLLGYIPLDPRLDRKRYRAVYSGKEVCS